MGRKADKNGTRKQLLGMFWKEAPVTRPFLVQRTQLTRAAIGLHINALIEDGIIEEVGFGKSIGGKMPVKLDLAKTTNCTFGLAIHDGHIQACLADFSDKVLFENQVRVSSRMSTDDVLNVIAGLANEVVSLVEEQGLYLRNTVIAVSGDLSPSGQVVESVHMPQLDGVYLGAYLEESAGIRPELVYTTHALFCGVLEGAMFEDRVGLISWTTGVGWTQAKGESLEFTNANPGVKKISHLRVKARNGRACYCGKSGCLEAEAGGWAILQMLAEEDSRYADLDIDQLAELASAGNETVVKVLSQSARLIGQSLAPAVFIFDPGYLRIETCLGLDRKRLISELKQGFAKSLHSEQIEALDIDVIDSADEAIVKGTCRLARMIFFDEEIIPRLRSEM